MPHTPGPWKWVIDEYDECKLIKGLADSNGNIIFDIDLVPYEHGFEELCFRNECDANLIAAAPMLLEEAKQVVANRDCACGTLKACCICRLRAAIAAAEGGEDKS